jgi:hypothetical protein
MAAPPARARADYDYLIKLLLIGDSGESLPLPPRSARDLVRGLICRHGWDLAPPLDQFTEMPV